MNELEKPVQEEKLSPFLSIWLHPKKTARYVLENKGIGYVIFVLCIGYIGSMCTGLIDSQLYPNIPIWGIFLLLIILSPILGLISNAIGAFLIWIFGKIFKGIGTYKEIFQSMALISIPYVVLIPFYLIWMLIDPDSLFYPELEGSFIFPFFVIFLTIVTAVWSFVITIAVVAESHQISNWKAFFTILIPSIIIFTLILIVVFVIAFVFIGITSMTGY